MIDYIILIISTPIILFINYFFNNEKDEEKRNKKYSLIDECVTLMIAAFVLVLLFWISSLFICFLIVSFLNA